MGAQVAAIVLAVLGVVAGYNILTHGNAASAIVSSTAGGSASVIKSLQGR